MKLVAISEDGASAARYLHFVQLAKRAAAWGSVSKVSFASSVNQQATFTLECDGSDEDFAVLKGAAIEAGFGVSE
jgi:hypothetical protein